MKFPTLSILKSPGLKIAKSNLKFADDFKFTVKNMSDFQKHLKKSSKLRSILKSIAKHPIRTTLWAGTLGTSAGLINYLVQYMKNNSGCFIYKDKKPQCKIKSLSCCNNESSNYCSNESALLSILPNANTICDNYNADKEKECCRKCSCDYLDCSNLKEGETIQCSKKTLSDALTEFGKNTGIAIGETLGGITSGLFSNVIGIPMLIIVCIGFIIVIYIFRNKIR